MEHVPQDPRTPTDAWTRWLATESEVFFLYARQQTRCESDAKDVLQEALTEAWGNAGGRVPGKALVFATIRRRAIDLGRSIDRRSRREQNFAGERPCWFAPDYAARDTREHLVSAIEGLPDHLREVLVLKIWGELTFPEISELTDSPVATATSRFRYALERLRNSEHLAELKS